MSDGVVAECRDHVAVDGEPIEGCFGNREHWVWLPHAAVGRSPCDCVAVGALADREPAVGGRRDPLGGDDSLVEVDAFPVLAVGRPPERGSRLPV